MAEPRTTTADDQAGGLRRSITGKQLFFYTLGDVLGSGIYVLIGLVAAAVGGAFWIAFALGVTVAAITGAAYAELVTKYPQAAGAALYVKKAFGSTALTFLVTVSFLSASFAASGSLATGFASYFATVWDGPPALLVSLVFLLALVVVNFIGITESVVMNMLMTFVEVAGLLIVMFIGIWYVVQGDADFGVLADISVSGNPALAVLAGIAFSFFAMTGFENTANVAEETIDPHRAFPRSLVGGMVVAGVVYVLVSMAAALTVPVDQLASSDAALLEVVRQGILPFSTDVMTTLFSIIALIAITNTTLVTIVTQPRILYGMAKEDVVPGVFATIHATRRSPWVGLLFSAGVVAALLITGPHRARGRWWHRPGQPAGPGDGGLPPGHLRPRDRRLPQAEGSGRGRTHVPGQHTAAGRRAARQPGHPRVLHLRRPGLAAVVRRPRRRRRGAVPHRVHARLAEPPSGHPPRRPRGHVPDGSLRCRSSSPPTGRRSHWPLPAT
ncbi:APC family permease [Blastococcus sp. PRF04-17]|uniref:APC family permease n=1 Tax=Blastococcus sp. PRF04-17 TaxID=2933797 RepID=UPI001FF4AAE3|nr:APC family permease [Blastococcus sp. PRF04-17]UOY01156.1 APC family permease [Blastococcus sp. PRF04-17]